MQTACSSSPLSALGDTHGDVLVNVAGVAVQGIEKVVEFYLQTLPADETVEIEIRRDDAQMTFEFGH